MKKLLVILLLLTTTNAIADIDVTGKFVPKNSGFTGLVDGDQVLCGSVADMLPAACYAVTYTGFLGPGYATFITQSFSFITNTAVKTTNASWVDLTDGGATILHSHAAGAGDMTKAVYDADDDGEVSETESNQTWTLHDSYPAACSAANFVTAIGDTLTCAPEDDPQVGFVTNLKWCVGDGTQVQCSTDPPSLLGSTIDDTEMTAEDFGDFSCTGGENGCTLDATYLTAVTTTFMFKPSVMDDHTSSGTYIYLTPHQNFTMGQVGYIAADGQIDLADADNSYTAPAFAMCATSAGCASGAGIKQFLKNGIVRDDTWDFTITGGSSNLVFLSAATAGLVTSVSPTGANNVVQILGTALTGDILMFEPQLVYVVHN